MTEYHGVLQNQKIRVYVCHDNSRLRKRLFIYINIHVYIYVCVCLKKDRSDFVLRAFSDSLGLTDERNRPPLLELMCGIAKLLLLNQAPSKTGTASEVQKVAPWPPNVDKVTNNAHDIPPGGGEALGGAAKAPKV